MFLYRSTLQLHLTMTVSYVFLELLKPCTFSMTDSIYSNGINVAFQLTLLVCCWPATPQNL